MIYRGLVVGLLGANALLLSQHGAVLERIDRDLVAESAPVGAVEAVDLVHISRGGAGEDPTDALGVGAREEIAEIDDRVVRGRGREALIERWDEASPGSYFELRIEEPRGAARRLLVMVTR